MTNTSLSAADTIRVATINLLHNPEEAEVRFQGLQAELEKVNPDVICLQEATGKPYNAPQLIQEVLGEMEFLHAPDEYHGRFAGNAVMVKKSILDVDQPTSFTTLDLPTPTHNARRVGLR